jgi:hypothetical protein
MFEIEGCGVGCGQCSELEQAEHVTAPQPAMAKQLVGSPSPFLKASYTTPCSLANCENQQQNTLVSPNAVSQG